MSLGLMKLCFIPARQIDDSKWKTSYPRISRPHRAFVTLVIGPESDSVTETQTQEPTSTSRLHYDLAESPHRALWYFEASRLLRAFHVANGESRWDQRPP